MHYLSQDQLLKFHDILDDDFPKQDSVPSKKLDENIKLNFFTNNDHKSGSLHELLDSIYDEISLIKQHPENYISPIYYEFYPLISLKNLLLRNIPIFYPIDETFITQVLMIYEDMDIARHTLNRFRKKFQIFSKKLSNEANSVVEKKVSF